MLVVLTGPASSGKDTIVSNLLAKYPKLSRVITTTTRLKRPNEVEDKDFHFVTKVKFEEMINNGEFLEYVEFLNDLYGTTKQAINPALLGQDLIWRVETSRAAKVSEVLPPEIFKHTLVIYIDVSDWKILENRMEKRGMSKDQISQRLEKDKKDFEEFGGFFQNIVHNEEGKLEETISKIETLINTKTTHEI